MHYRVSIIPNVLIITSSTFLEISFGIVDNVFKIDFNVSISVRTALLVHVTYDMNTKKYLEKSYIAYNLLYEILNILNVLKE